MDEYFPSGRHDSNMCVPLCTWAWKWAWDDSHVPQQVPGFRPTAGPQHENGHFAIRESRRQAGAKEHTQLNNNRGGNNRRRGRGNNNPRPQGANGGGGQQVNRIDSRARGNAPQMLEKYRKLANDAHLNGDRVNAEYYLQFADHYFRVIADTRVRQEEQRLRRDDRWQEGDSDTSENEDSGEYGVESEFPAFDQPPVYTRREREDRPERPDRAERPERVERAPERAANDRGQGNDRNPERQQPQPDSRRRDERPANDQQAVRRNGRNSEPAQPQFPLDEQAAEAPVATGDGNAASGEAVTAYEPPENPFLRENRGGRGLRPRREDRRPRREDRPEAAVLGETQETDRETRAIAAGIDPETLPPSFTVAREVPEVVAEERVAEAVAPEDIVAPAPRRRVRRKPAADDTGESIPSLT